MCVCAHVRESVCVSVCHARDHSCASSAALLSVVPSGEARVRIAGGACGRGRGRAVHRAVVKSQNGSFSDGQEHSLILQRNNGV